MKEIPLTKGKVAIVDDTDYEQLMQYKWQASCYRGTWYARRGGLAALGQRGMTFSMHREIMRPPAELEVDHKDGNGLNNTRGNLRICTPQENRFNQRKHKGMSRFKGVVFNGGKWMARINVNRKTIYIGKYNTEEAAARAYDEAARKHFGEFARVNFP